jgi:hypothetical protein
MEAFTYIYNQIVALGESHVYINSYNDDYDNIVAIHYYDSHVDPRISFGKVVDVRYNALQVFVRDTSFEAGYARIEAIRKLFEAYKYETMTITQKSDIQMMGNDDKSRSCFSVNFNMKFIGGTTVT